jgi:hypothetical protein
METSYYFPINSVALSDYFQAACIIPRKYFTNKPTIDSQSKIEAWLLLTKKIIGMSTDDCSLELVFNEEEVKKIVTIDDNFFLYSMPIPISRVKRVIFKSHEQMSTTLTNIEMSTAFVPKEIRKICNIEKINSIPAPPELEKPADYKSEIKKFDSLMGGFALMRLAGESEMNYSENYFSTLSLFSQKIKSELLKNNKEIIDKYFGREEFKKIRPLIDTRIEDEDVKRLSIEENQEFIKNPIGGLIDLSKLSGLVYIVAVLRQYKVGQESGSKKIDSLIRSNFQEIQKGEEIALCYGLNRGYFVFNNKYKDKIVKFQLNSKLDYYTIESLYQYAFYKDNKPDSFPYLDSWCPKLKISERIGKEDYRILDVVVVGKKIAFWERLKEMVSFFITNKISDKPLPLLFEEFGEKVYYEAKKDIEKEKNMIAQKKSLENNSYQQQEANVSIVTEVSNSSLSHQNVLEYIQKNLDDKKFIKKAKDDYGINISKKGSKGKKPEVQNSNDSILFKNE